MYRLTGYGSNFRRAETVDADGIVSMIFKMFDEGARRVTVTLESEDCDDDDL